MKRMLITQKFIEIEKNYSLNEEKNIDKMQCGMLNELKNIEHGR